MATEIIDSTMAEPPAVPEPPKLRLAQRLARLTAPKVTTAYDAVLQPLFAVVRQSHPETDLTLLERAFQVADGWHRGQRRKSGDPFITHPLAVATIAAELGMTETTLVAALLHDTVEDTAYTLDQLARDFGPEVAKLVDGVTKLDRDTHGQVAKAETIRKLIQAMVQDFRVVVIKLADRLHNMRTIGALRPDKQNRIAQETLEIYAPLAHRLGMNTIKWELEDLAFATMQPKLYDQLVQQVAAEQPARARILSEVTQIATEALKQRGIEAVVYGRPKHYYSIYQKMMVRGRDFTDIYDLLGVRVLVDSNDDCYVAMGAIHETWVPVPGRVKDYIANPKFSTYESIHTTVVGPQGKPVEFQIRTHQMHRNAEYGVAAHWKYKQEPKGAARSGRLDPMDLSWVRRLSQWQSEEADPEVFLDSLIFDLKGKEVMAFTPKSELIFLPVGSTPVDFAYAVHTEVGHHCIGARVNGKLVRLDTKLGDCDVCEILTSRAPDAGPSRDWLEFVKSPRARQKISQFFRRERRDEYIEQGKESLAKQLRRSGLPLQRLLTLPYLTAVAEDLDINDVSSLYAALGEGKIGSQHVVERLIAIEGGPEEAAEESLEDRPVFVVRPRRTNSANPGVKVEGDTSMWVKLARCCTPVPGDDIIGFVTHSQGISVHRRSCRNVSGLLATPERIVTVSWDQRVQDSFLVSVQIEGLDRTGLLADITASLAEDKVSIVSAAVKTDRSRTLRAQLSFEIPDPKFLDHVLKRLRAVREVTEVRRIKA
ncbi:MAG: bifunctional (p)ppGpp synthetase/guanosine-3',5'-bis(diphosphate) 3'-pyrophosphohydrolase [Propionibacteriaceae bacterium]|jgi:GTP pyrophosphokinase|nr:bifunctional (p)ppGpp synthetase/guanosine-3',5'-bis(diphosphate) 3'-pyrophosphohydrolase [Propionibacteriaceae bacterium]